MESSNKTAPEPAGSTSTSPETHELIVIGASGGIGQDLVRAFRGEHRVLGTYHRSDPEALEPGASYHSLDVTDRAAVADFTAEIASDLRRPVLVYTPGISPNNLSHKYTNEQWDEVVATNLTGAMLVCRGLLPAMRELGYGRILFLSSVLNKIAVPGTIAYSATKSALCAMARVMAAENAKKGITVNALCLGYFNVGIIKDVPDRYLESQVLPSIPQGKLGGTANIVEAIRFLIQADYMTGATLDINGGMQ